MVLGTLALLVVSLGYGVVVPLLPALAGNSHDAGMLSVVYAVYAASRIGVQLPGGVWVDRAGPWRVLGVGLGAFTLALAGFLVWDGLGAFALLRAVEGAATGLVYPAVFSLALQEAGGQHAGRKLGAVLGVGSAGLLLGPALGGWLGPVEPRLPVGVALVMSIAVTIVAQTQLARAPVPAAVPRTLHAEWKRITALATQPAFLALLLPVAFNKLSFTGLQGLLPLVGPDHLGLGTRGVTALFALVGVAFALAQGLGGPLADRVGLRRLVLGATVPLLASLLCLAVVRNPVGFSVALVVYVLASSVIFTAVLRHAAREYGSADTYGGVYGVLSTVTDTMTIAGPLLFLNLYPPSGTGVFAEMAGVGVLFALGFATLGRSAAVATARGTGPGSAARQEAADEATPR